MKNKYQLKGYTWIDGKLFTETFILESVEEAKTLARHRGPHMFKIIDVITNELIFTEILIDTGNQLPEYA